MVLFIIMLLFLVCFVHSSCDDDRGDFLYVYIHMREGRRNPVSTGWISGSLLSFRHSRKYENSSTVTADDAESVVQVKGIDIGSSVSAKRTSKDELHATVFVHLLGEFGAHQQLDSKELCLFAQTVLTRVASKLTLPIALVNGVVVGLDAASRDPDGMTVGVFRIRKSVTVRSHDSTNGTMDILVGGVREGSQGGLDGKGCLDTVN
jgi:hypothetical protein